MTTESSREAENRRLASLKSKQDMQALETHMRNLALETDAARNAELQAEEAVKIDTHWRAALGVGEMSVSWILSRGKKWQRSNEE